MSEDMNIIKTKIILDNRFVKYKNHFIETKVVHKPFIAEYLNAIIEENSDKDVIHITVYDSKDEEGKGYLNDVIDLLNDEQIVLHVINPRTFHYLPNCSKVHYYFPLEKDIMVRINKLTNAIKLYGADDLYNIVLVEDLRSITLNIG